MKKKPAQLNREISQSLTASGQPKLAALFSSPQRSVTYDCPCVAAGECSCHRVHVTERCECPACRQSAKTSHSTIKHDAALERYMRLATLARKWAEPHNPFRAHTDLRPYMQRVPKEHPGSLVDRQFWLGEVLDDIRRDAERELSRDELRRYEEHVEQLITGL